MSVFTSWWDTHSDQPRVANQSKANLLHHSKSIFEDLFRKDLVNQLVLHTSNS